METHHQSLFLIVGSVAIVGALLLWGAGFGEVESSTGMYSAYMAKWDPTVEHCVQNFNCPTNIQCCDPNGCYCSTELNGLRNNIGGRYIGREKLTAPTSREGIVLG